MKIVAALRWHNKFIDYMAINSETGEYVVDPKHIEIKSQKNGKGEIDKAINSFRKDVEKFGKIEMHAKIPRSHSNPEISQVSKYLEKSVKSLKDICKNGEIRFLMRDLKKDIGQRRITKALKSLGLYKHGESFIYKLWVVAFHVVPSNVDKKIKELKQLVQ